MREGKGEREVRAIDAHLHLDRIDPAHRQRFMKRLREDGIERVVAVATDERSCHELLALQAQYPGRVAIALGYHPEQPWDEGEVKRVLHLIRTHRQEIVAIGEVGLPYYSLPEEERQRGKGVQFLERVEPFVTLARELDLPLVLHAVHESTAPMLQLLRRYGIRRAHFHWLKAPLAVVRQLVETGYYVSVTPEVCYQTRDQELVRQVPKHLLLVETDAPWPYPRLFPRQPTEPKMVWAAIRMIARLWGWDEEATARQLYANTSHCYPQGNG